MLFKIFPSSLKIPIPISLETNQSNTIISLLPSCACLYFIFVLLRNTTNIWNHWELANKQTKPSPPKVLVRLHETSFYTPSHNGSFNSNHVALKSQLAHYQTLSHMHKPKQFSLIMYAQTQYSKWRPQRLHRPGKFIGDGDISRKYRGDFQKSDVKIGL